MRAFRHYLYSLLNLHLLKKVESFLTKFWNAFIILIFILLSSYSQESKLSLVLNYVLLLESIKERFDSLNIHRLPRKILFLTSHHAVLDANNNMSCWNETFFEQKD